MPTEKIAIEGVEAVPADVVAMLAGVSFGAVLKVIAAIGVVHDAAGVSFADILRIESLPTRLASEARRVATATAVNLIVSRPLPASPRRIMRLDQRFAAAAQICHTLEAALQTGEPTMNGA